MEGGPSTRLRLPYLLRSIRLDGETKPAGQHALPHERPRAEVIDPLITPAGPDHPADHPADRTLREGTIVGPARVFQERMLDVGVVLIYGRTGSKRFTLLSGARLCKDFRF